MAVVLYSVVITMNQHSPAQPILSLELRAYALWEERGRPWGTPEVDWFRAEREMQPRHSPGAQADAAEPLAVTTAKIVGAVLGSVSGVMSAVSSSFSSE